MKIYMLWQFLFNRSLLKRESRAIVLLYFRVLFHTSRIRIDEELVCDHLTHIEMLHRVTEQLLQSVHYDIDASKNQSSKEESLREESSLTKEEDLSI